MSTLIAIVAIAIVLFLLFKVFKVVVRIILALVFFGLAYLTNPDRIDHEIAIEEESKRSNISIAGKHILVKDFKIFSLSKISEGEDDKLVAAGLFNRVWVFGLK
jgi:hypothetical protein